MNTKQIMEEVFVLTNVDEVQGEVSVDSTDFQVKRVLALLNETGNELVSRGAWRTLVKMVTFTSPAEEGSLFKYTLPSDFHRPVEKGALLDDSSSRPCAIENDYGKWSVIRSTEGVLTAHDTYATFMGGDVLLTKSVPVTLTYVSKNWVKGGGDAVGADDSEFLVPPRCLLLGTKYRYLRARAEEDFEDARADYEASILSELNASRNQGSEVVASQTST